MSREETKIIEQTQKKLKKILEAKSKSNPPLKVTNVLLGFLPLSKSPDSRDFGDSFADTFESIFNEIERQEKFAKLAMRKTIADILQDITSQRERVEILSLEMARDK